MAEPGSYTAGLGQSRYGSTRAGPLQQHDRAATRILRGCESLERDSTGHGERGAEVVAGYPQEGAMVAGVREQQDEVVDSAIPPLPLETALQFL
jgi:hypothetical protein